MPTASEIPLVDQVREALQEAGTALRRDMWTDNDRAFLTARARDLVGLSGKAAATQDPARKAAYVAAAKDTVQHVKLVAMMRMEVAAAHVLDALGRFFLDKVLPMLVKLLPALAALL